MDLNRYFAAPDVDGSTPMHQYAELQKVSSQEDGKEGLGWVNGLNASCQCIVEVPRGSFIDNGLNWCYGIRLIQTSQAASVLLNEPRER